MKTETREFVGGPLDGETTREGGYEVHVPRFRSVSIAKYTKTPDPVEPAFHIGVYQLATYRLRDGTLQRCYRWLGEP